MASHIIKPNRTKLIAAASTVLLIAGGYFLYSVFAVQGAGTLAQAPLNIVSSVQPSLIMAVDDSGSMDFETLVPTNDGSAWWNAASKSFIGLDQNDAANPSLLNFNQTGNSDDNTWKKYPYVLPFGNGNNNDGKANVDNVNDHFAIPPTPQFAWARASSVNRAYFDPTTVYKPWIESDGDYLQGVAGINPATGQVSAVSAPADPKRGTTRLNLTQPFAFNVANGVFTFHSGMVIPQGTQYQIQACANNGVVATAPQLAADQLANPTGWPIAQADRPVTGTGGRARCALAIRHFPATFYVPSDQADAVAAFIGYKTAAIVNDGGVRPDGVQLRRFQIVPNNFDVGFYQPAIDNFANWFSYYRKRHAGTRAGISLAFGDSKDKLRAGYFTINNRNTVTMRDMTLPAEKKLLFDDMFALRGNGGTPNKEAVVHMAEQFRRGPEANNAQPIRLACQKNFGMLFTDGFSNASTTSVTANVDGTGVTPFANPVFTDGVAGTMGDIAAYYYTLNLRPDLAAGKVRVPNQCDAANPDPRLDCQTNLHMNLYGITLNGRGLQFGVNAAATLDPYATNPTWPTSFPNRHPSAIDDIWHAAINSRGKYFNASSSDEIQNAVSQVLNAVTANDIPAGSIALTGARIGTGSLVVQPTYAALNNGTDWYSTLTAQTVSANPTSGVTSFTNVWEASTKLPAAGDRKIWLGKGSAAPETFTAGSVGSFAALCSNQAGGMARCSATGAELPALGGPAPAAPILLTEAVAYLRGDQSKEVIRFSDGKLRFRTKVLGDIVNSSPVVSAPTDDYGYRSLPSPFGTTYAAYLSGAKSGRRPMVYVGANDGMLHGFDGRTTALNGGIERFAYVPQSVLGHMGNLLFPYDVANQNAQRFEHRYFVDGPVVVSDTYYGAGWKTSLVASTGAGARGVFALDVSGVSAAAGAFAAADRLWEISDLNLALPLAVRQNIGNVLGKPVVVPVRTGTGAGPVSWRAIFGNGYNSVSGKAVLFLVDMDTGTPNITMIEANEAAAPAGSNGLGNIVAVDVWGPATDDTLTRKTRDGFADTVYAADQKGAVWKFDLRATAPANQTVPLFTTLRYTTGPESGTRQPILGGLTVAAGPAGGVLVYFGTGSFSFDGDTTDTTLQSLYAVLDKGTGTTVTRSNMLQQTVTSTVGGYRTTSSNQPTATSLGWYLDLPSGERFVGNPRIESGVVFMPTYAANAAVDCRAIGANWLYGLDSLTGAAGLSSVREGSPTGTAPGLGTGAISLQTPTTAPVKDIAVLAAPRLAPLGPAATAAELNAALLAQCSMVVQVAGAPPLYMPRACGRQSWRQVR